MKKIIAFLICVNFTFSPAYCEITDEFVNRTLDKSLKISQPENVIIQDTFAEKSLDKNLKIKPVSYSPITDTFAESNKAHGQYSAKIIDFEEIIPTVSNQNTAKKIVLFDTNNMISIPVRIKKAFTTKQNSQEGDYIEFETQNDVTLNKKHYPAGTTVMARIETISQNKAFGIPSDLVVGNFSLDGIPLAGEISEVGANRTLWLRPTVAALTVLLWGAGLLLIPIRGGHAQIKTTQTYTLYANK